MSRCAKLATIDQLLVQATTGLFQTMGIELTLLADEQVPPPRTGIVSAMGFSGNGLRGGITLVLERATVGALYPELDLTAVEATRDACGEVSNMLVGQLKHQLQSLGVVIHQALPITMAGDGLQLFAPWSGLSSWQVFRGRHGLVRIRLDVRFASTFSFAPDHAPTPGADAGETLFF